MARSFKSLFALCLSVFLLAGCSGLRLVDSDVTAFSTWSSAPPGPGTPYRFERLPSQQPQQPGSNPQDAIEAAARTALAKVGMELNPPAARFSVQVVLNTQIVDRYDYGYGGYGGFGWGGPGVFFGAGSYGPSVGMSLPLRFADPYFKRDLTLLVRDLSTQQVVFETRALHDGPWRDTLTVAPAMLDAALRGFPQPPAGPRRIDIEIPR